MRKIGKRKREERKKNTKSIHEFLDPLHLYY
jgi:hypothetical protein